MIFQLNERGLCGVLMDKGNLARLGDRKRDRDACSKVKEEIGAGSRSQETFTLGSVC